MIRLIHPFSFSFIDYPDPEDSSVVVYCVGCDNSCSGCHNIELKDVNNPDAKDFTINEFIDELELELNKHKTNKICLEGGDFLSAHNIIVTKSFLVRKPKHWDVCLYTGKDVVYAINNNVTGFTYLKCGHFDLEQQQPSIKTDEFFQLASKNQKLYDKDYKRLDVDGRYYFKEN